MNTFVKLCFGLLLVVVLAAGVTQMHPVESVGTVTVKLLAGGAKKLDAGAATIGDIDGTNFSYTAVQLATGADETANWEFDLPVNFDAAGVVTATYKWTNVTGTTGTVCLGIQTAGFANDDEFRDAALGAFVGATDTSTASDDIMVSPSITLTESWAAGDHVVLAATRDVDAGGSGCSADVMAEDMHLLTIDVSYAVNNAFSGE